ncbi:MAG TPA: AraC family transcriptional regulator [Prolixibacteraceae bacterium]|nr:AraC family transcriptional regulator [Prolixibacteraceae bacterium]
MARLKDGFKGERSIILPPFVVNELRTETLTKELFITDIGYYPQARFHFRERTEKEAGQYILMYCVEGEGWFSLGHQKHRVRQFQFFILPKGHAHSYGSNADNPWTIYWLHFDGEHAQFFAQGFDRPTDVSLSFHSRIEERIDLFDEIFTTLCKGYSKNNLIYATTSLFHFLGSMKFLGEYRENAKPSDKAQQIIEVAIHYMRENMERKVTLPEMAAHTGLSASRFSLLFQQQTGYPPLKYLNQLKIQKACHYLDFTDMKVNQISPTLGFDDAFYFTRLFTKMMGVSPTEYRAKKKG